jgi:hypothetical protein
MMSKTLVYRTKSYDYCLNFSKHNPFISFPSITKNATRCAKIVNADQLDTDIANNAVPQVQLTKEKKICVKLFLRLTI